MANIFAQGKIKDKIDWGICRNTYVKNSTEVLHCVDNPPCDGISIDHVSNYNDSLNVHFSSGIFNKVFYLMAKGFQ